MSPLRQACYAWLSIAWTLRRQACQRLALPLPIDGESDTDWGRRVMTQVKARGIEADMCDLCAHLGAGHPVGMWRLGRA